ncbi:MAG: DUF814 domain-containing protein [Chitinispirillaceae bacterium]|nr:DUF814 domain-containing protein [Chitinispirillaceae bacterium]
MSTGSEEINERYTRCRMLLTREIARLRKTVSATTIPHKEKRNALWLKQIGDSIAASASSIMPGLSIVSITNIHTGLRETVALNPKCSAEKNAVLYYKKSLRAQKNEKAATGNQVATIGNLNDLRDALHRLEKAAAEDPLLLNETIEQCIAILEGAAPGSTAGNKDTSTPSPYRRVSYEGWDIYIGKTDEQNDELSLKFAKASDIWFHVAGNAGSHVIIRRPKGTPEPPDTVIRAAAALSAWYSKQRNAPTVEVHMTEARNVRKRRGAPAGEVMIEQWKSLKVAPRPPESFT